MQAARDIRSALERAPEAVLEDLPSAGLAYVLARELLEQRLLVVVPDEERAEAVAADLAAFGARDVVLFPAESAVPFGAATPDARLVFEQMAVRQRILAGDRPSVIVAPATALQGRWLPDADFAKATAIWVPGEIVQHEALSRQFLKTGYNRVNLVEDPGTFAIRGGIVDVFPPGRARPVRLDLFGDEISSIKAFDPESQRTYEPEEMLAIHPIREVVFDEAEVARALQKLRAIADESDVPTRRIRELEQQLEQRNYFYGVEALWPLFYEGSQTVLEGLLGRETMLIVDREEEIEKVLADRWAKAEHERARAAERHELVLDVEQHLVPTARVLGVMRERQRVSSRRLALDGGVPVETRLRDWSSLSRELDERRKDASKGEILDPVAAELARRVEQRYEVFLACGGRGHAERLRELLVARRIDLPLLDALPEARSLGEPRRSPRRAVVVAGLSGGFVDELNRVAVLTDVEIFGAARQRPARRRKKASSDALTTLSALRDNDLVIHVDHGIGRYLGLKRLVVGGVDGDYVHLEYADGDKLYLPVYRLSLLQLYSGPSDVRVDKLGGTRWEKAKQRVRDAVLAIAHELLALQAKRKAQPGFALPPPDDHFRAFEATFPYEETPDQERAIKDVLGDLVREQPMDRLLCGDVGFGKTEVAIRAAFLAVHGGKQVAVLVPTTVLAEQHGQTFRERLAGQPLTVDVISRFRSAAETKELLTRVQSGHVDVLIGTHRLLSGDVHWKDLGLLVVDEEQRFGVKHKERIKALRSQVHVLTMTATPIPRTLHMAVLGLRDLSIIQTPPAERLSIRTEVARFDEELVAEAIRRELRRGGQVFFVHNRIESIAGVSELLKTLVPEARQAVAHGQMSPDDLERIMVEFVQRKTDLLICTAIIESGIDIPSANTMIVDRADTFGLAQLYQLRGRIGRGRERAYAYLLLPREEKITKDATERLAVLKRFSELGSGFQIASHDLDLRGAGDLLGADQSGNIAAVGFDLYSELLNEAVEKARGHRERHDFEPDIKLPVAAVVPESYMEQPMQRLAYYQRMAGAASDEQVFDIASEMEDVYGEAPDEVKNLVEVMVIRRRLKQLGVTQLTGALAAESITIGLSFLPEAPVDRAHLALLLERESGRYRLTPSGRLGITVATLPDTSPLDFLRRVRHELGVLRTAG